MEDGAPRHMNMHMMVMMMRRRRRQRVGRHDERTGLHACIPLSQPYGEDRHKEYQHEQNTAVSRQNMANTSIVQHLALMLAQCDAICMSLMTIAYFFIFLPLLPHFYSSL